MKKVYFGLVLVAFSYLYYSTNNQIVSTRINSPRNSFPVSNENVALTMSGDLSLVVVKNSPMSSTKISKSLDEKMKCYEDYFFSQDCDRSCLMEILTKKNSTTVKLLQQDWNTVVDLNEFGRQDIITQFYLALNQGGLLTGQDVLRQPNYNLSAALLLKTIENDPRNYVPYIYAALAFHKLKDRAQAQEVLAEMDQNATYYNTYYSDWAATMMIAASENMGGYAQSTGAYSTIPVPSGTELKFLLEYHFNRRRMADAVELFFNQFRNAHSSIAFIAPVLDYSFMLMLRGVKGQVRTDLMHKTMDEISRMTQEPLYKNFPETCDRKALDEWYLTYRNEIK